MTLSAATYILQAVAAGDFDADGDDDLALAVDNISVFPIRGEVLVLRNQGGGQFAAPADYRLPGLFPQCIEAVDVTGDGALDLVVCHARNLSGNADGQISLFAGQTVTGQPNGMFGRVYSGSVGTAPSGAAAGDLDGDGHDDLVVVDPDDAKVYLLYGTGGTDVFTAPTMLANVTTPVAALIDRIPGQARPQVLVSTQTGGKLMTFVQTAPRQFATPSDVRIGLLPAAMALGRMDDDAIDDLVVVSVLGAELWYGQSDGSFAFGESISDDDTLNRVALADLNGDGKLDVAASASTQDRVTVVLNGADVPFTPSPTPTVTQTPTRTGTPTPTNPDATPNTPTATRTPGGPTCAGDCNGNQQVVVNELIQGVNIALGNAVVSSCPAFDVDASGQVAVNELIAAVNAALTGCPAAS